MSESPERIMSGDRSKPMWKAIRRIRQKRTRRAVYALGCRCQDLELLLSVAVARIEWLETAQQGR